ncbi:MAG: phosphotransferase [Alphaproteobacteria bacterium]|nr:phosphotransferase [Alphaproteobacteria bacterium]
MSDRLEIQDSTVRELLKEQFPAWSDLPISPVKKSGWDNRTFHLGQDKLVRLPSAQRYAAQVEKEQRWLPKLAPELTVEIPQPLAIGRPSAIYPWHWSIYKWIDGENAEIIQPGKAMDHFAIDIANFLKELQGIDATDGPLAGKHNFYRGASLLVYDEETKGSIIALEDEIDSAKALGLWENCISSIYEGKSVWVHGDFSASNILVRNGSLAAVIDFGSLGVGDPACDLVIAWTFLDKNAEKIFSNKMNMDEDTWLRARGWALWKALISLVALEERASSCGQVQREIIGRVIAA